MTQIILTRRTPGSLGRRGTAGYHEPCSSRGSQPARRRLGGAEISDGDLITAAGCDLQVIRAPGHSWDWVELSCRPPTARC